MNNQIAKKPSSGGLANISEDTLKRLLDVQAQKIQLELKQTEISLKELDHNQKIADKSIDAQANDRKDERQVKKDMHKNSLFFAGFTILACVVLMAVALALNKEELALDFMKIVCGFAGGWGVSRATQKKSSDSEED